MNQNAHHGMNGFRPNNGASTSSHNFQEYPSAVSNQPIFNNNMPQQPSQQRPSSQWAQAMPMNIQPTQMPSQSQPPFNQQPWGNQMHPLPTFPNGIPSMGAFNMPFLPQQILQDAYALSTPVEGTDEPTLMARLIECQKRKESYKDALNSLHGKNGHSASLWKDYYLDHKERLDNWVKMCLLKEQSQSLMPNVKKPSLPVTKRESPPLATTRAFASAPIKKSRKNNQPTPPVQNEQSGGRRSTINSLTAPAPIFGNRLPPPNADVKVPEPPSRSPSPPTRIIPHRGRGNKYTQEDRDFFINFIGWRLKHDNTLTRHDLCDLLAEKAPHHTAQSWASHWSNNHDVPDKILAAARGDDYISDGSESSAEETSTVRRRPKYKDPSTSEEELDDSDSNANEQDNDDDDDDDTPLRVWTEEEMGQKGEPFTEADLYITAKYIASYPDWNITSSKDRWTPYSEMHPQRSAKSWTEYYRRHERALDKLIKKMRREGRQGSSAQSSASPLPDQCARPTRPPPKVKRKLDIESDDLSDKHRKRGRADED